MTDLDLARALAENDASALEALVERHYESLYRFLWRLSGSDEQARDLAQTTLLQARDSARGFRGASAFKTWLWRIAYRTFARSRREPRHEPIDASMSGLSWERSALEWVAFERALASLSPKLHDAFVLHALQELSVVETAAVLGIPIGTAKARIARARHALIAQLQDQEESNYVPVPNEA